MKEMDKIVFVGMIYLVSWLLITKIPRCHCFAPVHPHIFPHFMPQPFEGFHKEMYAPQPPPNPMYHPPDKTEIIVISDQAKNQHHHHHHHHYHQHGHRHSHGHKHDHRHSHGHRHKHGHSHDHRHEPTNFGYSSSAKKPPTKFNNPGFYNLMEGNKQHVFTKGQVHYHQPTFGKNKGGGGYHDKGYSHGFDDDFHQRFAANEQSYKMDDFRDDSAEDRFTSSYEDDGFGLHKSSQNVEGVFKSSEVEKSDGYFNHGATQIQLPFDREIHGSREDLSTSFMFNSPSLD